LFDETRLNHLLVSPAQGRRLSLSHYACAGGTLKVLNLSDTESLQAQWFDVATIQSTLNVRY